MSTSRAVRRTSLAVLAGSALLCAFGLASPTFARGTTAGTALSNVATATYTTNGAPVTATSNTVVIQVQEVLGVAVQANGNRVAVSPGDTERVLPFTVTNIGNGPERYKLVTRADVGGDNFDPICPRLVLDSNANGIFDPASDANYAAGSNDPELPSDGATTVFVICSIPTGVNNDDAGTVELEATAVTGFGTPGTVFAGQGINGIDAIVGASTARASAPNGFFAAVDFPTLVKTQSVTDAQGGTNPIPGAIITYTLVAAVRSGTAANAVISDPIPAGTTYEPGSLRLDTTTLSDAADLDAGRFTGTGVEVALGTLAAAAPRTVSFKVRINQQ